jgi:A/G-specific adenine glycosylase
MLQQTQVSRVVEKYNAFLYSFPTLTSLADASPREVREAWSGLGYYARARHLHQLAQTLRTPDGCHSLPAETSELRKLPGVGAYTAGAVASFAYERRAALVDTNVARVLLRMFAPRVRIKTAKGQKLAWQIAEVVLPRTGRAAWTHNQAVMELGALVCTARIRHCNRCPVAGLCETLSREGSANVA